MHFDSSQTSISCFFKLSKVKPQMYEVSTCGGCCSHSNCNVTLALISSTFFWTGWWIMLGLMAEYWEELNGHYILPGVFATLALVMINIVPAEHLSNSTYKSGCEDLMLKIWLFVGFMAAFGTLIGAAYILFNDYILNIYAIKKWPGYGVFLHTLFIFISNVVFRCRRANNFF